MNVVKRFAQAIRALEKDEAGNYAVADEIVTVVTTALYKRFGAAPVGTDANRWLAVLVAEEDQKVARGELQKSATLRARIKRLVRPVLEVAKGDGDVVEVDQPGRVKFPALMKSEAKAMNNKKLIKWRNRAAAAELVWDDLTGEEQALTWHQLANRVFLVTLPAGAPDPLISEEHVGFRWVTGQEARGWLADDVCLRACSSARALWEWC